MLLIRSLGRGNHPHVFSLPGGMASVWEKIPKLADKHFLKLLSLPTSLNRGTPDVKTCDLTLLVASIKARGVVIRVHDSN